MRQVYDKRRKLMVELMRDVGFGIPVMPQGAFYVFADASRWTDDSYAFAFELLEKAGVGVAPGVDFGQAGKHLLIEFSERMMFMHYLIHDRLFIRFIALWGLVMAVFLCGWTFSYFSLPEGILRGRLSGHLLGGNGLTGGSVWLEWLRLFAINASVVLLLMIAPNVLRTEGGFPFGYGTVTLQSVLCSAVLGTDSFAIPLGARCRRPYRSFGVQDSWKSAPMSSLLRQRSRFPGIVWWGNGRSRRSRSWFLPEPSP